jgi:hypothetical protein
MALPEQQVEQKDTPVSEPVTTTAIVPAKNLGDLESRIAQAVGFDSPEGIHSNFMAINFAKQMIREIEAAAVAHTEAYIQLNGSFQVGEIAYWLAPDKKTKCRNPKVALERLLEIFGGDVEKIAQCLASDALKQGQVKSYLKELKQDEFFDELFDNKTDDKLETGKPPKKLQIVNKAFMPKKIEQKDNQL